MNADIAFALAIDGWVEAALRSSPTDFSALVKRLPGVDPIFVAQCLESEQFSDNPIVGELVENARKKCSKRRSPHAIPVPHPLDFDWRYGSRAIRALTAAIRRLVPKDACIALVGAPTLVRPLLDQSADYQIHLIDRNELWRREFESINSYALDVSTDDCPKSLLSVADIAVIDPPWYDQAYSAFLWFARRLLRDSGMLAVSVLPIGTRPSASEDRECILNVAGDSGFTLEEQHPATLGYATPPFEINALHAAGIYARLDEWREGDLWLFSASSAKFSQRPVVSRGNWWRELSFKEVRIKFDIRAATGSSHIESIVTGNVLPSVSSRFSGREHASVWTSGNRVFACENSAALYQLCRGAAWDSDRGFTAEHPTAEESDQLAMIAGIISEERGEYGIRS